MENRTFSIDHGGNNYRVATTIRQRGGEMVLLIHGLGCSKATFRDIWARDEFMDYSLLSLDLIGFGNSSKSDLIVLQRLDISEKVMIGGSGHFMMNDNPDEFYPCLKKFLSST